MTDAMTEERRTPIATQNQLQAVNQTEFTIEAQSTRCGRIRRTRDMVELTVCLCGSPVESELRNKDTAVQCGYRGCETLWVSIFHALPAIASQ